MAYEVFAAARYCVIVVRVMNRWEQRGQLPDEHTIWLENPASTALGSLLARAGLSRFRPGSRRAPGTGSVLPFDHRLAATFRRDDHARPQALFGTSPLSATLEASAAKTEPSAVGLRGERMPHLPGLDGLRGLAVIGVLLFHGGFTWAKGGFLGVSTFFTLSGFLITNLLVREFDTSSTIALGRFWTRRFRRLLPAALIAIALVGVVWWRIGSPEQLAGLRGDMLGALAYMANWRFYSAGTSYADLFSAPSPLQHFWSLAIEEQFYLFFPPIVWGVMKVGRPAAADLAARRRRGGLGGARALARQQRRPRVLRHRHPGRRAPPRVPAGGVVVRSSRPTLGPPRSRRRRPHGHRSGRRGRVRGPAPHVLGLVRGVADLHPAHPRRLPRLCGGHDRDHLRRHPARSRVPRARRSRPAVGRAHLLRPLPVPLADLPDHRREAHRPVDGSAVRRAHGRHPRHRGGLVLPARTTDPSGPDDQDGPVVAERGAGRGARRGHHRLRGHPRPAPEPDPVRQSEAQRLRRRRRRSDRPERDGRGGRRRRRPRSCSWATRARSTPLPPSAPCSAPPVPRTSCPPRSPVGASPSRASCSPSGWGRPAT